MVVVGLVGLEWNCPSLWLERYDDNQFASLCELVGVPTLKVRLQAATLGRSEPIGTENGIW